MTKITLREWATPVVAGAFLLSATTGILIFFHLDSGLNKEAHEWLGWALVIGAAAHLISNFTAFKKRLEAPLTKIILGLFVAILLLSFIPVSENEAKEGMRTGVNALMNAPITLVAELAHKDTEKVISDLQGIGLEIANPQQSIQSVCGKDRETCMKAIGAIFNNVGIEQQKS